MPFDSITTLACSSDGKWLLSASYFGVVRLLDIEADKYIKSMRFAEPFNGSLAFTEDHVPVAAFHAHNQLHLVKVISGEDQVILQGPAEGLPFFSPDARMIGVRVGEGGIYLYDTKKHAGQTVNVRATRRDMIVACCLSTTTLAALTWNRVYLYDLAKAAPTRRMASDIGSSPKLFCFSSSRDITALLIREKEPVLWDLATDMPICSLPKHRIDYAALSANGRYIATIDDCSIIIWDTRNGALVKKHWNVDLEFRSVIFSGDSAKVFAGASDNKVSSWPCHTDKDTFDPDVAFADIKSAAKTK